MQEHLESGPRFTLMLLSSGLFFSAQVWPDDSRQLLLHWSPGNRPWHSGERRAHMMSGGPLQVDVLGMDS